MLPSFRAKASFFSRKARLFILWSPAFLFGKLLFLSFYFLTHPFLTRLLLLKWGVLYLFVLRFRLLSYKTLRGCFPCGRQPLFLQTFLFTSMCESGICEVDSRSLSFLYRTESVYISSEVGCYQCIARYGHRTEYGCSGGVFPDDFSGSFVNAVYASVRCAYIYGFSCQCRAGFYGSRSRAAVWCGVDQGIAYRAIPFLFQRFVIQRHKSFVCRAKDDFLVGE